MQVAILAGGKGTRLLGDQAPLPKPMIEVGGKPILWHIMKMYAHFGFREFILCLGYKGEAIKEYFVNRAGWRDRDFALDTTGPEPRLYPLEQPDEWRVVFADTGAETRTGGRLKRIERRIEGDHFFATYGDGVSDINFQDLLRYHRSHGKLATVTVVHPRSQWGVVSVGEDCLVTLFEEKPRVREWVNGGFYVFSRAVLESMTPDEDLERETLQRLTQQRQLVAYQHTGFWRCMDTYKDTIELNELWERGEAKWRVWER
jgi:glucose-1-phosphate cytidylyltransferase